MQPAKMTKAVETFTDRYPFVGPTFWILSVQYYIIQIVVAAAWLLPYSWTQNTISDLGNTACGIYNGRNVCSPLHSLMNASFICLGLTMIIGSVLVYHEFDKTFWSALGFMFMAVAGIGSFLVGFFPENKVGSIHVIGAGLVFLIGNIGLLVLGSVLLIPRSLRVYTLASGLLSLIALVFFFTKHFGSLGVGGVERIVAYPQTMWLIVFGLYISRNHFIARQQANS